MKKIPSQVYSYLSSIQQVHFFEDRISIDTKEGTYLYLDVSPNKDIYSYIDKISFQHYYKLTNSYEDQFSLFFLDEGENISDLETLCDLYSKSSQSTFMDSYKSRAIYNRMTHSIHSVMQYYYGMQDRIEEMYYPRESYYRFIIHISKVYMLLQLGEYYLNSWFQKGESVYREVLTIRNVSSNNFINGRIVDFSSSRRDLFVFELANYYMEHYKDENIIENISFFQKKFQMTEVENSLFYSLIANVEEISGESLEEVYSFLNYVQLTSSFLLEKYEEYQKKEEGLLEEQ